MIRKGLLDLESEDRANRIWRQLSFVNLLEIYYVHAPIKAGGALIHYLSDSTAVILNIVLGKCNIFVYTDYI